MDPRLTWKYRGVVQRPGESGLGVTAKRPTDYSLTGLSGVAK